MAARRHRKQHAAVPVRQVTRSGDQFTAGREETVHPLRDGISDVHDDTLDAFFDPSRFRLESLMQRQRGLVSMARHFAVASLVVPVAGVVLGLLGVLFAKEAQDMFELVGGKAADRRHAHQALTMGTIGAGLWLVGTIVLIYVLTAHGL